MLSFNLHLIILINYNSAVDILIKLNRLYSSTNYHDIDHAWLSGRTNSSKKILIMRKNICHVLENVPLCLLSLPLLFLCITMTNYIFLGPTLFK